jgi:hypothetical protein
MSAANKPELEAGDYKKNDKESLARSVLNIVSQRLASVKQHA